MWDLKYQQTRGISIGASEWKKKCMHNMLHLLKQVLWVARDKAQATLNSDPLLKVTFNGCFHSRSFQTSSGKKNN